MVGRQQLSLLSEKPTYLLWNAAPHSCFLLLSKTFIRLTLDPKLISFNVNLRMLSKACFLSSCWNERKRLCTCRNSGAPRCMRHPWIRLNRTFQCRLFSSNSFSFLFPSSDKWAAQACQRKPFAALLFPWKQTAPPPPTKDGEYFLDQYVPIHCTYEYQNN